jgi:NTP pyrophosphatase (non-canonical NTP hydrolase)
MNQNLLEEYTDFVDKVTSESSKSSDKMRERIDYLNSRDIEMSRLLTAGIGLSGEVGEFNEIIKKVMFQEKTFDDVAHEHMKRELGDIMWYVAQACLALKIDLVDVINGNKEKLSKRFPQKQFNEQADANRDLEDI